MSTTHRRIASAAGLAALALLLSAPRALAQDRAPEEESAGAAPKQEVPPGQDEDDAARERAKQILEGHGQAVAGNDAQQEMIELFGKVERRLRKVDLLLSDAGAGDTSRLTEVGAAGIDELLRNSAAESRSAIEEIDRILQIAAELSSQSSSSSSSGDSGQTEGEQPGESSSPLDRSQSSTRREATPEAPSQQSEQQGEQQQQGEGQQPHQQGEQPGGEQRQRDGQPRDPGASDQTDTRNQEGPNPPGQGGPQVGAGVDGGQRWGDLPPNVRDVFRAEAIGEVPPRYRDWIDAYYARLNAKSSRRR